jgi:hypothetical protein
MRRLFLVCLLAGLSLPAAAATAAQLAPGDGTLAVRNASGDTGQLCVALAINGAAIGQVDHGRVTVLPGVGPEPDVTGADRQIDRVDGSTVYLGTNLRFRAVGGTFRIRISGTGIDINAVGQGTARLAGPTVASNPSSPSGPGKFSLNSGPWTPLPDGGATFTIGA